MSRIALLNLIPKADKANYLGFNQGLGNLSAVLRREGFQTSAFSIADAAADLSSVRGFSPDLVYVYLTANQYPLFAALLDGPLGAMGASVFAGGPHPSAAPEETLALSGLDGVRIGEGERAAVEIARRRGAAETLEGVSNVWFKQGEAIVRNPVGDYVEDLDSLPFPDRSIFPYETLLRLPAARVVGIEFLATRSCVYSCRYCINAHWRSLHGKGCVRRRSVDHFLAEMRELKKRFSYSGIIGIHDDIFTLDKNWLDEFCERYPREIGLPFWCNAHISKLSESVIGALAAAGCVRVHMGIECGNESVRAKVLNKHLSNDGILEKIRLLKKHRIKAVTTFMIGLPDETESNILESIALCRAMAPDWVLLSVFCPYPGTDLYTELAAQGRVDPHFYRHLSSDTFYAAKPHYDQGVLPDEKIAYYFQNFRKLAGVKG